MRGEKFRSKRVGELIRKEIASMIHHGLKDHRLEGAIVSIVEVRVDNELTVADVYTSVLPDSRRADVVEALDHASGFIRSRLSRELHIRQMPELRFQLDTSIEDGMRLQKIIEDLNPSEGDSEDV